jgi:hypothetical protein
MYRFVSSFGTMLSVLVLSLTLLMRNQALKASPRGEHIFNYLAQLMPAFTILWVYTFFAQYLIIWYAD